MRGAHLGCIGLRGQGAGSRLVFADKSSASKGCIRDGCNNPGLNSGIGNVECLSGLPFRQDALQMLGLGRAVRSGFCMPEQRIRYKASSGPGNSTKLCILGHGQGQPRPVLKEGSLNSIPPSKLRGNRKGVGNGTLFSQDLQGDIAAFRAGETERYKGRKIMDISRPSICGCWWTTATSRSFSATSCMTCRPRSR